MRSEAESGTQPTPARFWRLRNSTEPPVIGRELAGGGETVRSHESCFPPPAAHRRLPEAPWEGGGREGLGEPLLGMMEVASRSRFASLEDSYDPGLFVCVCGGGASGLRVCDFQEFRWESGGA